ncbi:hypothetical protein SADUNF_Sadunf08G0014300 [Salix dunnii]|uniref:Uncharacterized protein n=1 Tax=Salix dunnii TaxID=1413687 RepID=A0A835JWY6_9ROSI|nr:hypothetical protein SADUNF_Sadunf08G0014300 [Salix dunnii]
MTLFGHLCSLQIAPCSNLRPSTDNVCENSASGSLTRPKLHKTWPRWARTNGKYWSNFSPKTRVLNRDDDRGRRVGQKLSSWSKIYKPMHLSAFLSDSMVSPSPVPASNSLSYKSTVSWISTLRLKELKQKQICPVPCSVVINSNGGVKRGLVDTSKWNPSPNDFSLALLYVLPHERCLLYHQEDNELSRV